MFCAFALATLTLARIQVAVAPEVAVSFAAGLDRAIQRSNAGKVTLELSANPGPEAEGDDETN